ncbi:hypothetical protein F5148DRAFT_792280 [Russula earlei]|uniref:Uncharacterized protein n=1 Tax=Russula earlei TaxID=71964 RepID=A0ACC0UM92_9AGAM|nr:hypothetical protein F5148DRAFT_792280 [Russula earlei]
MPVGDTPASDTVRHSLPLFPRDATSHGHTTIIIAVSASVGALLVTFLFFRILSRLLGRSRSVPLPPRQALVHQRELQLAAFDEHKNANVPDHQLSMPMYHGSTTSLVQHINGSSTNVSNSCLTDEGPEAGPPSYRVHRHRPKPPFAAPGIASNASPPSRPLPSPPLSEAATPTTISSSRPIKRLEPSPSSTVPTQSSTMTTRSRLGVRGVPHATHSNVQIVLPAPLAPNLYERSAWEGPQNPRPFLGDGTHVEPWTGSLVDTWVMIGQKGAPKPQHMEPRSSHDSLEGRSRARQRDPSPGALKPRSKSNPPPPSRLRLSSRPSLNDTRQEDHHPVPRVPSQHWAAPSGQHARRRSLNPPSAFTGP